MFSFRFTVSYCFDCRPDEWPRLPTAALLTADQSEAEGRMDGMTWNVDTRRQYTEIKNDVFFHFLGCFVLKSIDDIQGNLNLGIAL